MSIANCQFLGDLPTRAFYELEVTNELSLRGNQFQEVHSHAFSFKRKCLSVFNYEQKPNWICLSCLQVKPE